MKTTFQSGEFRSEMERSEALQTMIARAEESRRLEWAAEVRDILRRWDHGHIFSRYNTKCIQCGILERDYHAQPFDERMGCWQLSQKEPVALDSPLPAPNHASPLTCASPR